MIWDLLKIKVPYYAISFLVNVIILGHYISVIISFILCSFPKSKRQFYEISTKIISLQPQQCYNFWICAVRINKKLDIYIFLIDIRL
jgi:hypothetical protein